MRRFIPHAAKPALRLGRIAAALVTLLLLLIANATVTAQSESAVVSFVLVDADTEAPIVGYDPIEMDSVIDLDTLPTYNINIAVLTSGDEPASVTFDFDGEENYAVDNYAPFTIGGDTNGNYFGWTPAPGKHEITAFPFSEDNGEGKIGEGATLRFEIVTSAENLPPNVNIDADAVMTLPANSAILNGSARDPEGKDDTLTILWALQDAPLGSDLPKMSGISSESLLLEELVEGTYRFRMNVIDEDGAGNFAEAFVYVYGALDQEPIVDAGESVEMTLPRAAATLYGTAYDDGEIVDYEWEQLDGPMDVLLNGRTTATLQVSNMRRVGHYWFQLTVMDDKGQTAVDTASISINPDPNNLAPTVTASENITLTLPVNSAELFATFSDSDGQLDFAEWYKVSGPAATITPTLGFTTTVSSLVEGDYVFRLNAFDNSGNVGFDTVRVLVQPEPNDPPVLTVGDNVTLSFPQTETTLSATATDIDGTVDSWLWEQESGPVGAILWTPDTSDLSVTNLPVGTHMFKVTATDDDGEQSFDYVNVTVENELARVEPTIIGDLVQWHPVMFSFAGPASDETAVEPNPFLDYRLQVNFISPSGRQFNVPGFFNGNGAGAGSGDQWAVRFTADEPGEWQYDVHFTGGKFIAVDLDLDNGMATGMHGSSGSFVVAGVDPNAPGFLSKGRLQAAGESYLQFPDGTHWIKTGVHSPENWLGYAGFDNTVDQGNFGGGMTNGVHRFATHVSHWQEGDPNWTGKNSYGEYDGKGLIGALNYLASQNVNAIHLLPMNLGGDGRETYPFVSAENSPTAKTQYDISKLTQWTELFDHAQRLGIQVHVGLSEGNSENATWLDDGQLDIERKLFYREMVARFGASLGIKWNHGSEFQGSLDLLRDSASYLATIDWANHPQSVHLSAEDSFIYTDILGDAALRTLISVTSAQYPVVLDGAIVNQSSDARTEHLRSESDRSGQSWVIDMDQNTPEDVGLTPDNIDAMRKRVLYNVLFSGGNLEWHMGESIANIELESFETLQPMWEQSWYARRFLTENTPFWEMQADDSLLEYGRIDGQVFYKADTIYAVYLPDGQPNGENAQLDLSAETRTFSRRWFNPRTGRFQGAEKSVISGGIANLGNPPAEANEDWVVLLIAQDQMAPTAVALDMVNSSDDGYYLSLALACLALMLVARWSLFRPKPAPATKQEE